MQVLPRLTECFDENDVIHTVHGLHSPAHLGYTEHLWQILEKRVTLHHHHHHQNTKFGNPSAHGGPTPYYFTTVQSLDYFYN